MTDLELGPLRFGIVGAGKLGTCIGRALQRAGFELVHVSCATPEGRERAAKALQVPAHEDPLAVAEQVDCVVLCVPDDAVRGVVARLAQRPADASPIRLRVVGTSAAAGRAALTPLDEAGHVTCVVHPVASIAVEDAEPAALTGAGAAIGAGDDAARTFATAFAHALELLPFGVEDDGWVLHAAACTLAANGVAALLAIVEDLAAEAGVHAGVARSAYGRLAGTAVDRAVRLGPLPSLAGPVVRGDAVAVARQVAAVRESSTDAEALFIPVVATVANRAFTGGLMDMQTHRELLEAVLDPTQFGDEGFRYRDDAPGGPT